MKLNSKVLTFVSILFIVLSYFSLPSNAQGNILLELEDPLNDDYGPGTYGYPTNEAFQGEGLFDISYFSIRDMGDKYQLNFTFQNLIDPWNSKYGFSLPLIELYIGEKGTGSTDLYREGANIRLDPRYPWSRMLKISGWWVRTYSPEDTNEEADLWDVENNPANVKDLTVDVKDNNIIIQINKELIGDLVNAHVYILVGSYDPFGQDHFRDITNDASSWYFSDLTNESLEYAPRVLDIILPANLDQKKVLGDFAEDYPLVSPINITPTNKTIIYLPPIVLGLLILAYFIMNKIYPLSNNK